MHIKLPNSAGTMEPYTLSGNTCITGKMPDNPSRQVFVATHVTVNPFTNDPSGNPAIDWQATLAFRHHLHDLGLGIAESMDTSQRGMGLDYTNALELIRQTRQELPQANVFNGVGTDQMKHDKARRLEDVRVAYLEQLEAVQSIGGRVILMASRALARLTDDSDDYLQLYSQILSDCDQPVIIHWLGEMFDPALTGYWGSRDFNTAMHTVLSLIESHEQKIDGIKISLLSKDKEIKMRRLLPTTVKMYTGDDFNYPELIAGDNQGFSHALLGIFNPLAPIAAAAIQRLHGKDTQEFRLLMDPTLELAREIFCFPSRYYKTGIVFLAWLNDFQDHFVMLNGAQSMRSLPHFARIFRLADGCGLLTKPDFAIDRMKRLLALYGI